MVRGFLSTLLLGDVGVDRAGVSVANLGQGGRRVVDDRVDPNELLEDRQPDRDDQGGSQPSGLELAEAALALLLVDLADLTDLLLGPLALAYLVEDLARLLLLALADEEAGRL